MSGVDHPPKAFESSRQDEHLVQRCRNGDKDAWDGLIDKYKNLVYSIPVKYGFPQQDANEIFQAVCLTLLAEIGNLREPRALAAWLIATTSRRCFRFRKEQGRVLELDSAEFELPASESQIPDRLFQQLEQEHIVREALEELGPVCRQLVDLLFYREPPMPYDEAAKLLGLAKGSMGATRMRCLDKLKSRLQNRGLR